MHELLEFLKTLTDPDKLRAFLATVLSGWWSYALLFAIVFAETGLLVGFFLPGDSLLFTVGVVAGAGDQVEAAAVVADMARALEAAEKEGAEQAGSEAHAVGSLCAVSWKDAGGVGGPVGRDGRGDRTGPERWSAAGVPGRGENTKV